MMARTIFRYAFALSILFPVPLCVFTTAVSTMAVEVEPHSLHVSKAQGQRDLASYAKTFSNLAEWQARAKNLYDGTNPSKI